MGANTLVAIDALISLINLGVRGLEAAQRVGAVIQQAQAEGRDISDEEIQTIQAQRHAAVQRWDSLP